MNNDARFSNIESAARRLIEGVFERFSGETLDGGMIASRLAQSFEELVDEGKAEHTNFYEVHLNPNDHQRVLQIEPGIAERLGEWLPQLASQVGVTVVSAPIVQLVPDEIIRAGRLLIRSEIDPNREDNRTTMNSRKAIETEMLKLVQQRNAWLIIDGKQHVDLNEIVMHIGRRTDNEIVIDSPTISRVHAQLRWRFNHFNLFDLGSRAGIIVNGERIEECSLQPGDVIQMAEVSFIYGEGNDSADQETGRHENPRTRRR
ncbi:MAG: FhaA domain-containing protein [Anaerolineae bacterium]